MTTSRAYIGASLISIAGLLFWVLVMPAYDTIGNQRDALAERILILEKRAQIMANIDQLTKEYSSRAADIERFSSIVPARKSIPEIISAIQALATNNGLQLSTIALGNNTSADKNPYQSQLIDLNLSGSYPAFKSFLLALERNIRLIDIYSIDASPASDNSPIISFRLKGNAYYLK